MPDVHQDFEREKLYEEIWSEPVSKVSKRYQISDVGLRKICVNLDIPVPPIGYWAKLAAGKTVKKPSLPPTKGATTYRRSVFKTRTTTSCHCALRSESMRTPLVPQMYRPSSYAPPSTNACRSSNGWRKSSKVSNGNSRTWPYCDGAGLMRVVVSQQNSLRALLVLNALLETLTGAGYSLSSGGKEEDPAYVTLLDGKLTFRVKERSRQESIPLTWEQQAENKRLRFNRNSESYIFHPTDVFEISAFKLGRSYATANIADTRSLPVETKIQAFVSRLRHLVIRDSVQAEMAAEQQAIAAAKEAERVRLRERFAESRLAI